jgi:hypothetical protein
MRAKSERRPHRKRKAKLAGNGRYVARNSETPRNVDASGGVYPQGPDAACLRALACPQHNQYDRLLTRFAPNGPTRPRCGQRGLGPRADTNMTTYAYRIALDDSEIIAVREALTRYQSFWDEQLAQGPRAPYWAHRRSIEAVLNRLESNPQMASTSSFPQNPLVPQWKAPLVDWEKPSEERPNSIASGFVACCPNPPRPRA